MEPAVIHLCGDAGHMALTVHTPYILQSMLCFCVLHSFTSSEQKQYLMEKGSVSIIFLVKPITSLQGCTFCTLAVVVS